MHNILKLYRVSFCATGQSLSSSTKFERVFMIQHAPFSEKGAEIASMRKEKNCGTISV